MIRGVYLVLKTALVCAIISLSFSHVYANDDARDISIRYSADVEGKQYSRIQNRFKKPKKTIKPRPNKKRKTMQYKILKGDTLFAISKKFNVKFDDLCDSNSFAGDEKIIAGKIINIPISEDSHNSTVQNKSHEAKSDIKPSFIWPVQNAKGYKQDSDEGARPLGIIIKGNPGARVLASADGTVEKIGCMRGFGKYVVIKHEGRYATVYSNLDKISVSEGQKISQRSSIGKIESNSRGLHFQIDRAGKPTNPLDFLPIKS